MPSVVLTVVSRYKIWISNVSQFILLQYIRPLLFITSAAKLIFYVATCNVKIYLREEINGLIIVLHEVARLLFAPGKVGFEAPSRLTHPEYPIGLLNPDSFLAGHSEGSV